MWSGHACLSVADIRKVGGCKGFPVAVRWSRKAKLGKAYRLSVVVFVHIEWRQLCGLCFWGRGSFCVAWRPLFFSFCPPYVCPRGCSAGFKLHGNYHGVILCFKRQSQILELCCRGHRWIHMHGWSHTYAQTAAKPYGHILYSLCCHQTTKYILWQLKLKTAACDNKQGHTVGQRLALRASHHWDPSCCRPRLCGACMFSPHVLWFPPGSPVSSHSQQQASRSTGDYKLTWGVNGVCALPRTNNLSRVYSMWASDVSWWVRSRLKDELMT